MDTKLLINLHEGIVEVVGSEEFVRSVYDDFKDKISDDVEQGLDRAEVDSQSQESASPSNRKKRRKAAHPPKGASCRARILQLKKEGFFREQRAPTDIVAGLKGKGWTHTGAQVTAALTVMFNKGEIQRTAESAGGNFKYFWDRD